MAIALTSKNHITSQRRIGDRDVDRKNRTIHFDMAVAYTNGRVTSVTEDGVTTSMTYNVSGLVATISYPRGSKTRTETYFYNAADQVTGMTAVEI